MGLISFIWSGLIPVPDREREWVLEGERVPMTFTEGHGVTYANRARVKGGPDLEPGEQVTVREVSDAEKPRLTQGNWRVAADAESGADAPSEEAREPTADDTREPVFPFSVDLGDREYRVIHEPTCPYEGRVVHEPNGSVIALREYDERVLLHEALHLLSQSVPGGTSLTPEQEERLVRRVTHGLFSMGWRWRIRDRDANKVEAERDRFATQVERFRVALEYLADAESWHGNPESHEAMLFGHDTPHELAREVLSRLESSDT